MMNLLFLWCLEFLTDGNVSMMALHLLNGAGYLKFSLTALAVIVSIAPYLAFE